MNKTLINILLILSILVNVTVITKCQDYRHEVKISLNNIDSLNDTIKIIKTKYNDVVISKSSLVGELNDMKTLNSLLYQDINQLKKEIKTKSDIISGLTIKTEIQNELHDTIWQYTALDTVVTKQFDFSNDYRQLCGNVTFDSDKYQLGMSITKDIMNVDYTIAIDENNKVYVKTTNPYVNIYSLDSFIIPKQKTKHFSVGPYIGIEYDFSSNNFLPSIGLSLQYSLFKF